jgi:pimeloyl-ACP methyl ester carboxylesterase
MKRPLAAPNFEDKLLKIITIPDFLSEIGRVPLNANQSRPGSVRLMTIHRISAGVLDVAYLSYGPADGWLCFLMHGFPYDAHAYAEAALLLAAEGAHVIVPWLRGYGPTRFLSPATPRSGEQAVLGADLLALMDALHISKATLAGYDWGGRACCIVSALWPRARGSACY